MWNKLWKIPDVKSFSLFSIVMIIMISIYICLQDEEVVRESENNYRLNEIITFEKIIQFDPTGCARRYVCTIATKSNKKQNQYERNLIQILISLEFFNHITKIIPDWLSIVIMRNVKFVKLNRKFDAASAMEKLKKVVEEKTKMIIK